MNLRDLQDHPKEWEIILPHSIFSILGRTPTLYSVYLDVLSELYDETTRETSGTGLAYARARDIADRVVDAHGLSQLPAEDEFADPAYENNTSISQGAKIVRRLEKAGWLKRQSDKLTREQVVLFPPYAHLLLPALHTLQRGETIDHDAMLVAILELLAQEGKTSRRSAILQASDLMARLKISRLSRIQELAAFRPTAEQLEGRNLADWLDDFLESPTHEDYNKFKLRHSLDRWYVEIVDHIRRLYQQVETIAVEKNPTAKLKLMDDDAREEANQLASHLRRLENDLDGLGDLVDEMDRLYTEITRIYGRRQQMALTSSVAGTVFAATNKVMQGLHEMKQPRRGNTDIERGLGIFHLQSVAPQTVVWEYRMIRTQSTAGYEIVLDESEPPSPTRRASPERYPGPKEIETFYAQVFGEREELSVAELLGHSYADAYRLSRLIDYCGLASGFGFEIVALDETETESLVENEFKALSPITIRRRKQKRSRK